MAENVLYQLGLDLGLVLGFILTVFRRIINFHHSRVAPLGSTKNNRCKHSLPINSTNFKKVLGLRLGLVLDSKDSLLYYTP